MVLALLAALLVSASPSAQQARRLADAGQWDELYLAFATGSAEGMAEGDAKVIGEALARGCEALLAEDAVLAFSIADRAGVYAPTVSGLRCLATAARATQQLSAAERALRDGLKRFPREGFFGLALGRQLLDESDAAGARAALERVPPESPEAGAAALMLVEAKRRLSEEAAAKKGAAAVERRIASGAASAETPGTRSAPALASRSGTTTFSSGVGPGGMRTRANSRFVIRYFDNARDFGQRADYEGDVVSALEEAYAHTRKLLGEAREAPVDVILYTREEFALHQGQARAQMIAGLYSQDAIRINDAAELNTQTKATLVHEYVHAAVDGFIGGRADRVPTWLNEGLAEYVEWRYLGSDEPPAHVRTRLRAAALQDRQPKLAELAEGMLVARADPGLAYATSGVAVRLLVQRKGARAVVDLVRAVGGGTPFTTALAREFGLSPQKLDEEVRQALTRR